MRPRIRTFNVTSPLPDNDHPLIVADWPGRMVDIAAISGIHGNLGALKAVLADAAEQRADLIVDPGDICPSGPQPAETPSCCGNHDRGDAARLALANGRSDRARALMTGRV